MWVVEQAALGTGEDWHGNFDGFCQSARETKRLVPTECTLGSLGWLLRDQWAGKHSPLVLSSCAVSFCFND